MTTRTRAAAKKSETMLSLQAKVLYRDRDGQISDVTHENLFGLKKFAEDAGLARYILDNCRKRLNRLLMAVEGRPSIDAGLVRLAITDVRSELEDGSHLACYVGITHELFSNSDPIAGPGMPGARTAARALSRSAAD